MIPPTVSASMTAQCHGLAKNVMDSLKRFGQFGKVWKGVQDFGKVWKSLESLEKNGMLGKLGKFGKLRKFVLE